MSTVNLGACRSLNALLIDGQSWRTAQTTSSVSVRFQPGDFASPLPSEISDAWLGTPRGTAMGFDLPKSLALLLVSPRQWYPSACRRSTRHPRGNRPPTHAD